MEDHTIVTYFLCPYIYSCRGQYKYHFLKGDSFFCFGKEIKELLKQMTMSKTYYLFHHRYLVHCLLRVIRGVVCICEDIYCFSCSFPPRFGTFHNILHIWFILIKEKIVLVKTSSIYKDQKKQVYLIEIFVDYSQEVVRWVPQVRTWKATSSKELQYKKWIYQNSVYSSNLKFNTCKETFSQIKFPGLSPRINLTSVASEAAPKKTVLPYASRQSLWKRSKTSPLGWCTAATTVMASLAAILAMCLMTW